MCQCIRMDHAAEYRAIAQELPLRHLDAVGLVGLSTACGSSFFIEPLAAKGFGFWPTLIAVANKGLRSCSPLDRAAFVVDLAIRNIRAHPYTGWRNLSNPYAPPKPAGLNENLSLSSSFGFLPSLLPGLERTALEPFLSKIV